MRQGRPTKVKKRKIMIVVRWSYLSQHQAKLKEIKQKKGCIIEEKRKRKKNQRLMY